MTIRPFNYDTDLADVLKLLGTSLSRSGNADWFKWKHRNNPFGASPGYVAFIDEKLIGARFFLRWEFILNEQCIHALRPVDTVTHPEARGKGVFKKLTLHGLAALSPDKEVFIFNTPNGNSLPGYLKMGWKVWPDQLNYFYALRPWKRQPKVNLMKQVEASDIPEDEYQIGTYTTHRSPEFVRWRYKGKIYRFACFTNGTPGLLVYRVIMIKRIRIVDVSDFVGPSAKAMALINATAAAERSPVIRILNQEGKISATGWQWRLRKGSSLVAMRTAMHRDDLRFNFSSGDLESLL